jgi:hypothetical protein
MTSQGSPRGRFQRAIQRGSLFQAELTARELGALTLADALALTVLIGKEPERYGRAAVRQHGRFELEARRLDLWESQLALAGARRSPEGSGCCGVGLGNGMASGWAQVAPSDLAISTARTIELASAATRPALFGLAFGLTPASRTSSALRR